MASPGFPRTPHRAGPMASNASLEGPPNPASQSPASSRLSRSPHPVPHRCSHMFTALHTTRRFGVSSVSAGISAKCEAVIGPVAVTTGPLGPPGGRSGSVELEGLSRRAPESIQVVHRNDRPFGTSRTIRLAPRAIDEIGRGTFRRGGGPGFDDGARPMNGLGRRGGSQTRSNPPVESGQSPQ